MKDFLIKALIIGAVVFVMAAFFSGIDSGGRWP